MGAKLNIIGLEFMTFEGKKVKVIEYEKSRKVTIQFENGATSIVKYDNLKVGKVFEPQNFLGEIGFNNVGLEMKIIEHNKYDDIVVEFKSGYTRRCSYKDFKKGSVKDLLHKSVRGIGYFGIGEFSSAKNKHQKHHKTWTGMLERCYLSDANKNKTYIDVTVCEEWHNFQNFAKWFEENYIEGYALDKDLLSENNKIYSPETCCFIPQWLNNFLTNNQSSNSSGYAGVTKNRGKWVAQINRSLVDSNKQYIGTFDTKESAYSAYLKEKINLSNVAIKSLDRKKDSKIIIAINKYISKLTQQSEEIKCKIKKQ